MVLLVLSVLLLLGFLGVLWRCYRPEVPAAGVNDQRTNFELTLLVELVAFAKEFAGELVFLLVLTGPHWSSLVLSGPGIWLLVAMTRAIPQ